MTDISNENPRKLPYPLLNPETTESILPDSGFLIVPLEDIFSDNETKVRVELELSLNEYVALANAIDVGRDIAYNEDSRFIWQIWVSAIRGKIMTCEDFNDCIENNPGTSSALYQWAVQNGIYDPNNANDNTPLAPNVFPDSAREEEISASPAGCDKDILWAGIFEIVKRLDDNAKTILENAVIYNDVLERWGNFASAIPVVGSTIASVQKTVSEVIPDIYNLYLSYSSQANMEVIACSIFELVCNECRYPTYNELYNVYASNAVGGVGDLDTLTLRALMEGFASSSNLAASVAYSSMIIVELFALYVGGRVLNINGIDAITFMALLGEDSPSDDWALLCNGCGAPPSTCWVFWGGTTSGLAGIDNGNGTFTSQDSDDGDPTTQQRICIETQGDATPVIFTGSGTPIPNPSLVRVWTGQTPFAGSLIFSGTWNSFVANSPVSGGSIVISGSTQYTVEFAIGVDECV